MHGYGELSFDDLVYRGEFQNDKVCGVGQLYN